MKVSVIGCGYLGAVHAVSMAKLGHDVIAVDIDETKIRLLASGIAPFYEPQLPELLAEGLSSGRLHFTTHPSALTEVQVHFIGVGTPQRANSKAADLQYVDQAFETLFKYAKPGSVVVGKSTVPVGTAARLDDELQKRVPGAVLIWNPEFLREGFSVQDTLHPDRVVYGLPEREGAKQAAACLDEVYVQLIREEIPFVVTDYATAELVKVSANAFLATKISFINAMAEISETVGADVTELAEAIGYDVRIGRQFLNSGIGFGGGCLPKDIRAFHARAEEVGRLDAVQFLTEVDAINERRRDRVVELVLQTVGRSDGSLDGITVACLGIAFKPGSDDTRNSPALDIIMRLHRAGAKVQATDPKAIEVARLEFPDIDYRDDAMGAFAGADVSILLTEWKEFREIDPVVAARYVAQSRIIDARNALEVKKWHEAGWEYHALGRPRVIERLVQKR